jgi:hypothetical protein
LQVVVAGVVAEESKVAAARLFAGVGSLLRQALAVEVVVTLRQEWFAAVAVPAQSGLSVATEPLKEVVKVRFYEALFRFSGKD